MVRFLSTVLAVVTGIFVSLFLLGFGIGVLFSAGGNVKKSVPKDTVLTLDLRQEIADAPPANGLAFGGPQATVVGIVDALQKASTDGSVKGLLLRVGAGSGMLPAQAQEIRGAIADFAKAGKFVVTHFQDFEDPGLSGYYMASVGTEVWMQPSGGILSSGLGTSNMFFKGTLDKLDSSAQVLNYYEYKTAMHPFLYSDYTAAHREESLGLITSIFNSWTGEIAASRKLKLEDFKAKLTGVPYIGTEALKASLVDKLGFDVDAEEAAKAKAGAGAETLDIGEYAERAGSAYAKGALIALVQGEGMIIEGKSQDGFFGSSGMMASDTVSSAILEAAKDKNVKAIIFRVNSPGGSATASDQIWNAVEVAQKKGKPVIINMSGLAASGGYWVSMGADKIIAEPTTITGSIGVVGGKFILKGVYDKLGISVGELQVGNDKQFMFSEQHPFTNEEWAVLRKAFDSVYFNFTHKVADGRKLPLDQVLANAKGRVWTGAQAAEKERGLVDEIGGLKTAIASARTLAKLPADAPVELRRYPAPKGFFDAVFGAMGASAHVARTLSTLADVFALAPSAKLIDAARRADAFERQRIQALSAPVDIR
ncbi:MAG: signal peptide peptidase SppA [Alphaproteobacteria bacterium]